MPDQSERKAKDPIADWSNDAREHVVAYWLWLGSIPIRRPIRRPDLFLTTDWYDGAADL